MPNGTGIEDDAAVTKNCGGCARTQVEMAQTLDTKRTQRPTVSLTGEKGLAVPGSRSEP